MNRGGRAPGPLRPDPGDLALLVVGVLAVSTSAPLIRWAAAPALAVAFWRNALGTVVLAPVAAARDRATLRAGRRERRLSLMAGACLAAHFATWIPSLSYTSVASSVALVATQPVWAALIARARGEAVPAAAWLGIAAAVGGATLLGGIDVTISARALAGDVLALAGGVFAAAYVTVGAEVRRTWSTTAYATVCYGTASAALLVVTLAAGQPLAGYPARTWLALAGLTLGAQLLGHTVFNKVLRTASPLVVSVSILFEIVGATVLARLWFGETPPAAVLPAAGLIVAGVALVVRAGDRPPIASVPAVE